MTAIEAALLGLIQGLTEFLPVSSSGHLVIGQTLFGLSGDHLAFDVLVHGATLLAVLFYFRGRPAGHTSSRSGSRPSPPSLWAPSSIHGSGRHSRSRRWWPASSR